MSRGPSTFRQRDVTRALKAAKAAGFPVAKVEISREGTIVRTAETTQDAATEGDAAPNRIIL